MGPLTPVNLPSYWEIQILVQMTELPAKDVKMFLFPWPV